MPQHAIDLRTAQSIEGLKAPSSPIQFAREAIAIWRGFKALDASVAEARIEGESRMVVSTGRKSSAEFLTQDGLIGTSSEHRALYATPEGLRVGIRRTITSPTLHGDHATVSHAPLEFVAPSVRTALYLAKTHSLASLTQAVTEALT